MLIIENLRRGVSVVELVQGVLGLLGAAVAQEADDHPEGDDEGRAADRTRDVGENVLDRDVAAARVEPLLGQLFVHDSVVENPIGASVVLNSAACRQHVRDGVVARTSLWLDGGSVSGLGCIRNRFFSCLRFRDGGSS